MHSQKHLTKLLKNLSLAQIKNVKVEFNPFHSKTRSIREFLFQISAQRVRETNNKCSLKIDVKSDGSDPNVDVKFVDGHKLQINTRNLTTYEIANLFSEHCLKRTENKAET
ncbi:unnamed protein product [Owenia fusiformis]|uniref:Large ribosomal subunit protein mL53 n=1 Tax=Owenia fusiformis TaxID=6347 RepID=A0A8S4MYC2_OWEFU|nr:unnamed protein product [Owenia fusiformis]